MGEKTVDISAFLEVPKDTIEDDVREHLEQHGFYLKSEARLTGQGTLMYVIEGPQQNIADLKEATTPSYRFYPNIKMEPCGE
ncbi:hypothetical protein HY495_01005 [Candidatus Woesearchaeota archaeon]|nr:hypothetical protein [Candidatus Woesearchaeota archaeon]